MDTKSIQKLQALHPKVAAIAVAAYNEACQKTPANVHPYVVQGLRTFEESDALYALGRTKVNPDGKTAKKPKGNIVTNAKAGQSYHNYGLAFDIGILVDGKDVWTMNPIVTEVFKAHGFEWGGDFKTLLDEPHFEMRFGHNWRDLLASHNAKKFIKGTEFVVI